MCEGAKKKTTLLHSMNERRGKNGRGKLDNQVSPPHSGALLLLGITLPFPIFGTVAR